MSDWGRRLLDWVVGRPPESDVGVAPGGQPGRSSVLGETGEAHGMGDGDLINDAEAYGVRVIQVAAEPGAVIWRVIRVHHLTPEENGGRHHIFLDVLDEEGNRIMGAQVRVTWQDGEQIVTIDKPANEPGANFPMWKGQICNVEGVGLPSDRVENLHTAHPDEAPGNTLFHHSFLVVFQRTTVGEPPQGSVVLGRVHNGAGMTVLLLRDAQEVPLSEGEQEVARAVVDQNEQFRMEGLPPGRYVVRVMGTEVVSDPIILDGHNTVEVELTVPSASGVIEGWVNNGVGRTVLALRDGTVEVARAVVAEDESFRLEGLAPGTYVVAVEGTDVRSQPITLAPGATETLELTVPSDEETPSARPLTHYVLLGPEGAPGERTNYFLAAPYIAHFQLAFGYSLTEAQQAARVTIIGNGYGLAEEAALRAAGCQVERIDGDADTVRQTLAARIADDQPWP